MAQFDIYRNPNPASANTIPYLLDVQSYLLSHLITRMVAPLSRPGALKRQDCRPTQSGI